MASTTINPGLEIWHLCWKDDSFRMAEWYDNNTENSITFTNGIITTTGVYGTTPSPALTNGDELTLPSGITIEKHFGTDATILAIPTTLITNINLRAKYVTEEATLTITLLNSSFSSTGSTTVTIDSAGYLRYTIAAPSLSDPVAGITLSTSKNIVIDYICFATYDLINQGGMTLDVTIPKKTVSQAIPNSYDIMQQVGISSRSKAVTIPKVGVATYRWLEGIMLNSTPLELVTPTEQATGYLSDIQRDSEAGWVDSLLATSDTLSIQTLTAQQLYDISFSLVKADNEQNIDITAPAPTAPYIQPTQVTIQPVMPPPDFTPIGNPVTLEVSKFTEDRNAKLVTYPRVQAFLDTSLVIGLFNSTYTLTTVVPQQFAVGEDIETLLAALQYPYQLLTDAEGYGDYVMITQTAPSHTGGQPYYYSADITATSLGLPLLVPTPPPIPPTEIDVDVFLGGQNIYYAQGLWWFFYTSDENGFGYKTTATGATWSSFNPITVNVDLNIYATWVNGTTFYYGTVLASDKFYARYGTMNTDGSITWALTEKTITDETSTSHIHISLDTTGLLWVVGSNYNGSGSDVFQLNSFASDGTFTDVDRPSFTDVNGYGAAFSVFATSSTNISMVFTGGGSSVPHFVGATYNGSGWSGEDNYLESYSYAGENGGAAIQMPSGLIVALGNKDNIGYSAIWNPSTLTWSTPIEVIANSLTTASNAILTWNSISSALIAIWVSPDGDEILYSSFADDEWSSPVIVVNSSGIVGLTGMYSFVDTPGNQIGIGWIEGADAEGTAYFASFVP